MISVSNESLFSSRTGRKKLFSILIEKMKILKVWSPETNIPTPVEKFQFTRISKRKDRCSVFNPDYTIWKCSTLKAEASVFETSPGRVSCDVLLQSYRSSKIHDFPITIFLIFELCAVIYLITMNMYIFKSRK